MSATTPMMRQYLEIKADYPDAILFFRLGDFYEMFLEDAVTASRVLDITLTSRNKGAAEEVPLCGIPFHSCQPYIARLVENGYKVAICEQVEDPRTAKGIVRREVVRVVTPGLVIDSDTLQPKENNFLAALARHRDGRWGVAVLDITTGEFRTTEVAEIEGVCSELASFNPREVLLAEGESAAESDRGLGPALAGRCLNRLPDWVFEPDRATELLCRFFDCSSLEAFGCAALPAAVGAAGAILHYLEETQKGTVSHIRSLQTYQSNDFMVLDEATRRNLELTATLYDGSRKGSLLGLLDRTMTAMGGRQLRHWIHQPLRQVEAIRRRHGAVEELVDQVALRRDLRQALDGVYDLERLAAKVALANANAKDLIALRASLEKVPAVLGMLRQLGSPLAGQLAGAIDLLDDVVALVRDAIIDDPPFVLREGGATPCGSGWRSIGSNQTWAAGASPSA
jgi:DNA mismatch repair protein MutS